MFQFDFFGAVKYYLERIASDKLGKTGYKKQFMNSLMKL